jgi:hypothetical protein
LQSLQSRPFICEQPVEIGGVRKIDFACVDNLRLTGVYLQGAELPVAAQTLIEQRLLLFDQPGFQ